MLQFFLYLPPLSFSFSVLNFEMFVKCNKIQLFWVLYIRGRHCNSNITFQTSQSNKTPHQDSVGAKGKSILSNFERIVLFDRISRRNPRLTVKFLCLLPDWVAYFSSRNALLVKIFSWQDFRCLFNLQIGSCG